MRIASVSHAVFAAILTAIGIVGLVKGGFAPIWDGAPKALPGREALAYLCTLVSLACGIGLLWRRSAVPAVRLLLAYLLIWIVLVKGRFIVLQPTVEVSYESTGETAVIVAGTWVLYAWLANEWDKQHLPFATGDRGVRIARIVYALALIAFGLSHFAYPDNTASLVPGWLPWHAAWVYFTGSAYLAAAAGILFGVVPRLAALLSTLQMGGFTLLIWLPLVAAGHFDADTLGECGVSLMLTASGWLLADSYRDTPWLAVGKR
jgi:uncharacterized membrane protein